MIKLEAICKEVQNDLNSRMLAEIASAMNKVFTADDILKSILFEHRYMVSGNEIENHYWHGGNIDIYGDGGILIGSQQTHYQQMTQVSHRFSYSVKTVNISLRPLSSFRNFISAGKDFISASSIIKLASMNSHDLILRHGGDISAICLAVAGLLVAAHYSRRIELRYEDACALVIAWGCADYIEGKYICSIDDILEDIDLMESVFGVHDFSKNKLLNSMGNQASIGAIRVNGPAITLIESVSISDYEQVSWDKVPEHFRRIAFRGQQQEQ